MRVAVDFDEDFINEDSIAISTMLTVQSTGIEGAELYTSETRWLLRIQWCLAGREDLQYRGD